VSSWQHAISPLCRDVELTYAYFDDGEAETLEEAVDVIDIVAFLRTLTGDQPTFVMPLQPPSENDTPRPKPFE